MTRDDVIRIAREAGFTPSRDDWVFTETLERFAAVVAAAERERVLAIASEACRPYGKTGAVVMTSIRAKVQP